jgi:hypothetical protein
MEDITADAASRVRCPRHPDGEITEEAKADNTPGIAGAGGAWVYLICKQCAPAYFSDALARYYVQSSGGQKPLTGPFGFDTVIGWGEL